MSVKVHTASMYGADLYTESDIKGVYVHTTRTMLAGELTWNGQRYEYEFVREIGYMGNFGSTPRLVRGMFPSKVDGDDVYNAAYDAHDWLYSVKGELTFPMSSWTRSECNDFMRGVLRESEYVKRKGRAARLFAGIVNASVEAFAGGKSHWGNDSYGSMNKATMKLDPIPG